MRAHFTVARGHRSGLTLLAAALVTLTCVASAPRAQANDFAHQHEGRPPHATPVRDQGAGLAVSPADSDRVALQKKWGIELLPLRATAAGYMLDLRFRVVDAALAAPLLGRHIARYLIVAKSGAVLNVPSTERLGALRTAVRTPNMVKEGRIYTALFANPGRHVKAGDKVTLVLGEFRAEHVPVATADR